LIGPAAGPGRGLSADRLRSTQAISYRPRQPARRAVNGSHGSWPSGSKACVQTACKPGQWVKWVMTIWI